jgi:hypothetical protein
MSGSKRIHTIKGSLEEHCWIALRERMHMDVGLLDVLRPQRSFASLVPGAMDHMHRVAAPRQRLGEFGPTPTADAVVRRKNITDDQ